MTGQTADIVHLGDVGSTNDEAMARLGAGAPAVWVVARRQTKGRGRRGRLWVSQAGNLYASFGFRPDWDAERIGLLPLVAAVALADALHDFVDARLKWPNDVLVDGQKCAGILIETEMVDRSGARRVVIGFGVNVAHAPEAAPSGEACGADAAAGLAPAPTHLARYAPAVTVEAVFFRLRQALAACVSSFSRPGGAAAIVEQWRERAVGIGGPVVVRYEKERIAGRFLGLDPAGRLILGQEGGGTRLIAAGDVFIRTERL